MYTQTKLNYIMTKKEHFTHGFKGFFLIQGMNIFTHLWNSLWGGLVSNNRWIFIFNWHKKCVKILSKIELLGITEKKICTWAFIYMYVSHAFHMVSLFLFAFGLWLNMWLGSELFIIHHKDLWRSYLC